MRDLGECRNNKVNKETEKLVMEETERKWKVYFYRRSHKQRCEKS